MTITLVVPLFNEAESLRLLAEGVAEVFKTLVHEYRILFVDDGSTDSSALVLKELHDADPQHVAVIRFNRNYGKSAALSVGIERAEGDIIVTMDADLQDDPAAIPAMLEQLEKGFDLVSGWKKKRHDPLSKTLPSKLFNSVVSIMSGVHLHDFNCGFKVYRAQTAKNLEIYGERHRFLPVLAHWDGAKVTELPVPHHARKFGKSKFGLERLTNGLLDLITLLFLRKYLKRPLHFFGLLGIVLAGSGCAVLGYFGIQWIITNEMRIRPLVLLSVGAVIMGIQFVSIGLIGEMITNASERNSYGIREELW